MVQSTGCCLFFSSRRRHTRLTCDWSSDVCSSDLAIRGEATFDDWRHWRTAPRELRLNMNGTKRVDLNHGSPWRPSQGLIATLPREKIGRASCRERVQVRGGGAH